MDVLARDSMTSVDFVNGIFNGIIPFNELALITTCCALNIHCVILLKETILSSKAMLSTDKCLLKLAYTSDNTFKELS